MTTKYDTIAKVAAELKELARDFDTPIITAMPHPRPRLPLSVTQHTYDCERRALAGPIFIDAIWLLIHDG